MWVARLAQAPARPPAAAACARLRPANGEARARGRRRRRCRAMPRVPHAPLQGRGARGCTWAASRCWCRATSWWACRCPRPSSPSSRPSRRAPPAPGPAACRRRLPPAACRLLLPAAQRACRLPLDAAPCGCRLLPLLRPPHATAARRSRRCPRPPARAPRPPRAAPCFVRLVSAEGVPERVRALGQGAEEDCGHRGRAAAVEHAQRRRAGRHHLPELASGPLARRRRLRQGGRLRRGVLRRGVCATAAAAAPRLAAGPSAPRPPPLPPLASTSTSTRPQAGPELGRQVCQGGCSPALPAPPAARGPGLACAQVLVGQTRPPRCGGTARAPAAAPPRSIAGGLWWPTSRWPLAGAGTRAPQRAPPAPPTHTIPPGPDGGHQAAGRRRAGRHPPRLALGAAPGAPGACRAGLRHAAPRCAALRCLGATSAWQALDAKSRRSVSLHAPRPRGPRSHPPCLPTPRLSAHLQPACRPPSLPERTHPPTHSPALTRAGQGGPPGRGAGAVPVLGRGRPVRGPAGQGGRGERTAAQARLGLHCAEGEDEGGWQRCT